MMPDEKKYPRASKVSKMADAAVEDMLDFPKSTAQGMGRYGLAAASYLPAAAVDTVERMIKKKKDSEDVEKKAKGGSVKSASARADGCAQRGKTKGRMV